MASQKRTYLSKSGRVASIKSTFSNWPIYFLALFSFHYNGISYGGMACTPYLRGQGVQNLVVFTNRTFWPNGHGDQNLVVFTNRAFWPNGHYGGSHRVGLWKYIRGQATFSRYTHFMVHNGYHTYFWHDLQCGLRALKEPSQESLKLQRCSKPQFYIRMTFFLF